MKRNLLLFAACAMLLAGCNPDVNVSKVDMTAKLDMGLALPIGTLSFRASDFLDILTDATNGQIQIDKDGLFFFERDSTLGKEFHPFNVGKFSTGGTKQTFALQGLNMSGEVPIDIIQTFTQKVHLDFPNMNNLPNEERIDSLFVSEAKFMATIESSNLPLKYLNKVNLLLPDNIHPLNGTRTLPLISKTPNAGQTSIVVPIEMKNFYLNLMKDRTATPAQNNVITGIDFDIEYQLYIPAGETVTINSDTKIDMTLGCDIIDYDYVWGYFKPGKDMHDNDSINIGKEWLEYLRFNSLKLMLAEPQIELFVWHKMAMPLTCKFITLEAVNNNGDRATAMFGGSTSTDFHLYNFIDPSSPIDAPYYNKYLAQTERADSINYRRFDNSVNGGQIHELFAIDPDVLVWNFNIFVNEHDFPNMAQYRMGKDSKLYLRYLAHIPFKFNPGFDISYTDTLKVNKDDEVLAANPESSLNLSLDSLIKDINMIDSLSAAELKLFVETENNLPFDVKLKLSYFDENNVELPDFHLLDSISMRHREVKEGNKYPTTDLLTIQLDEKTLEKLNHLNHVIYTATLDGNVEAPATIYNYDKVNIKFAVAASVEAYLDLAKIKTEE